MVSSLSRLWKHTRITKHTQRQSVRACSSELLAVCLSARQGRCHFLLHAVFTTCCHKRFQIIVESVQITGCLDSKKFPVLTSKRSRRSSGGGAVKGTVMWRLFRKHKLLICQADELNSDGGRSHGETNKNLGIQMFAFSD